jgi:hypothetical protein
MRTVLTLGRLSLVSLVSLGLMGCGPEPECDEGSPDEDCVLEEEPDAVPEDYPTYQAIKDELGALATEEHAELVNLSERTSVGPTEEGRSLWALRIGAAPDEGLPVQIVIAGLHPREVVPPVVALALAGQLLTSPDQTLQDWTTWVVSMANPDGYVHVLEVDNLWRKNRAHFDGGTGVDLNRNFPFGWDSECGGEREVSHRRYRGPEAASEAETRTLMALIEAERPARLLDLHSYGRTTKYGYSCHTHPLDDHLAESAAQVSDDMGFDGANDRPSAEGEMFEWTYAELGGEALLLELMDQFQPPWEETEAELNAMVEGLLTVLSRPVAVSGFVRDTQTGLPLAANISVDGVSPENGERMGSGGEQGRFDLDLPDGRWEIDFQLDGYNPEVRSIDVEGGESTSLIVELDPAS